MGCISSCYKECPNDGLDLNTYYEIVKLQEREKIEPGLETWEAVISDQEQRFNNKQLDYAHHWPKDQEFDNATTSFRRDLMNHKPVWVNNWKKDWWNFMKTNHALISIFTAPKVDEFTRRERAVVLLCCSSLFSIVALIAVTVEAKQIELGHESLGIFVWNNLITVTGAITVSIIQLYLQCMATCSCYQNDEDVRERMELWGHVTMAVWLLGGAFFFVYGLIESESVGLVDKFFISFFIQAIMNIIVPTLLLTGQFHLMWKAEHKNSDECQCGDKWEVCYHDYLDYKSGQKLRREWKPKETKNNLANTVGNTAKNLAKKIVVVEKNAENKVIDLTKKSAATVASVGSKLTKKNDNDHENNPDNEQLEKHMELA